MKRIVLLAALAAVALSGRSLARSPEAKPRPTVQIAILLDTSNSMDGLIAQAKTQLWSIVNEFVRARKDGRQPSIQVALFEYGKLSLPSEQGFVRLILPMTDDLDKVSEELFALKTNGGDEYCGWVIREAANRLEWSRDRDVYKAIFIAGNEPFSQGPVDFHSSCKTAISRGILVNTIFCGNVAEGANTGWKDGAILADGRYLSIDADKQVADVVTPHDAEIARLGVALNKTYLTYGSMGRAGLMRQSAQDSNAFSASNNAIVSRSVSKANPLYCADTWDLVDAIKNGKAKLDDLKDEELPEEFRKLDKAARKAKVEEAAKQRETISSQVMELNKKREAYLAAERKKNAAAGKDETLDQAITKAIREQAVRCRISFD